MPGCRRRMPFGITIPNSANSPGIGLTCAVRLNKSLARPVQAQSRLLLDVLDQHKTHARPRNRLGDCLRIARVVLVRLHVGLHKL